MPMKNNTRQKIAKLLPAMRISIGLVLLTVSILLVADIMGYIPNQSKSELTARKKISEALAIQFSTLASQRDQKKIGKTLEMLVRRDAYIISAGIRDSQGGLAFQAGSHAQLWNTDINDRSTATQVRVPIYKGNTKWGTVEIVFKSVAWESGFGLLSRSTFILIGFVTVMGFFGYLFVIRRTLRELDPSAVIPERVNAAFNTLEEGVLILDEKEHIVLANTAFAENLERSSESLIGVKASELEWDTQSSKIEEDPFPWIQTLDNGDSHIGVSLELNVKSVGKRVFTVNSAPILSNKGKPRGALVTFDDVTELAQKNDQLHKMVNKLEVTQAEVQRQNKELHYLATKDPLTGCLNRRAFNELFDEAFSKAKASQSELSCIMTDIDHFKSVNDTYGHGVGDEVIKLLADILHDHARENDFVGRYGGEEFCVVFPGFTIEQAAEVAERIRIATKDESGQKFSAGPRVTVSLGVASIVYEAKDPSDLNNQADRALYVAKESGRNRVIKWDADQITLAEQEPVSEVVESALADSGESIATAENVGHLAPNELEDSNDGEVDRLQVRIKQLESIASQYSEELKYKSSYDSLTGLPNELLFYDRVKQAIARAQRYNQSIAVLTLDIDLFKRVNNAFGRGAGDSLLKELADRLMTILRESDGVTVFGDDSKDLTLSRLGADEFGVLLTDLKDMQPVTWIVRRIFESLLQPIVIDDQEVVVTCNIGISLYPEDGITPEVLMNHAGAARQYAKQLTGQNSYQMFDAQMHQMSLTQMQVETELRRAIENEEFVLYYQPKLDMATSTVNGAEALIRWDHPKKGLLSPYEFIDVAEQSGLIVNIGEWVIKQACLQVKAWMNLSDKDFRVAVNLSTVQLRQKGFSERIVEIVEAAGILPSQLELEITETVIMDNLETAVDTLGRLHKKGFWISIDDFGTGYSSLNYLKHLPLDTLKIDRSFLQDIMTDSYDKTIVKTIIAMAHSMELKVTAEGVETQEQLGLLRQYECDEIQGYLFSRPMTASDVTEILREGQASESHRKLIG